MGHPERRGGGVRGPVRGWFLTLAMRAGVSVDALLAMRAADVDALLRARRVS